MNKVLEKKYNELFTEEDKAKAFNKIAEMYYNQNFGSTSKQDIDLLMFSIYIEQILDKSEENISTYSDYTLSKALGITQSKIRNLKEKKELKYPYEGFDWKRSFERLSRNARYEDGKIKIELRDKNLYNEVKNFIEEKGGYIEAQLSTTLLQISPSYYIDFIVELEDEPNRNKIKRKLKKQFEKHNIDTKYFETESIGNQLKGAGKDVVIDIVEEIIKEIVFKNPIVKVLFDNFLKSLQKGLEKIK